MNKRVIFWFRNDLRIQDNEAFLKALQTGYEVVPVFVFDTRLFQKKKSGIRKTGVMRAQALLTAVTCLQNELRDRGSDLIIKTGLSEIVISELATEIDAVAVFLSKEVAFEEIRLESSLSKRLKVLNVDMEMVWTTTLYHPRDLPFWISQLPVSFAEYLNLIEQKWHIRIPYVFTGVLQAHSRLDGESIPTLTTLGFEEQEIKALSEMDNSLFSEISDFSRSDYSEFIKEFVQHAATPKYQRLFGFLLSVGMLSAKQAYYCVKRWEFEEKGSRIARELINQLLWRDFSIFLTLRYGSRIFKEYGLGLDLAKKGKKDKTVFGLWVEGETNNQEINDLMNRLAVTGYLTADEQARVAGLLVSELGIAWVWGASYLESVLVSYEVCPLWVNWNYYAGVGLGGTIPAVSHS